MLLHYFPDLFGGMRVAAFLYALDDVLDDLLLKPRICEDVIDQSHGSLFEG